MSELYLIHLVFSCAMYWCSVSKFLFRNEVIQSEFCVTGWDYEAVDGRPLSVTNKSSQAPQGICFISGTKSLKMASEWHLLPPGWVLRAGTPRHAGPQQGIGEVREKETLAQIFLSLLLLTFSRWKWYPSWVWTRATNLIRTLKRATKRTASDWHGCWPNAGA